MNSDDILDDIPASGVPTTFAAPSPRMPDKSTGTGRHSMALRGPDLYPTPAPITRALLENAPLPMRVWEPAAGLGHMSSVLIMRGLDVYATDLHDYGCPHVRGGIDFLASKSKDARFVSGSDVGAIVTNPPFSHAEAFVRHGLTIAPKVVVLGRLAFLESQRRKDLHERHLRQVLIFSERVPMMHRWVQRDDGTWVEWPGKKSGSAMAYAWYVYQREPSAFAPHIRWITWRDHATPSELLKFASSGEPDV